MTSTDPSLHKRALLPALLLAAAMAAAPASGNPGAPALHTSANQVNAGYYQLSWVAPDGGTPVFEVQEARTPQFADARLVYRGTDEASMLSGRRDGTYYYRARIDPKRDDPGPWSRTVKVSVHHLPLDRAFLFFGIGALVFVSTLGLVIVGNLRHNKEA
ncbi:MAG: hypothetical protein P8076_11725 [Gammaproteobacteria bacterium]